MILPEDLVEAVALRVVELLEERQAAAQPALAASLVDAATLAGVLGVTVEWVYDHAEELSVRRLGTGPRPRLRFDVGEARSALACSAGSGSQPLGSPAAEPSAALSPRRRARRVPAGLPDPGSVLAIRPRSPGAERAA